MKNFIYRKKLFLLPGLSVRFTEQMILKRIKNIFIILLVSGFVLGNASCSSSKKAAAAKAKAEQEAKLEKERQEKLKQEEAERQKKIDEANAREKNQKAPADKLDNYFEQIATASGDDMANQTINSAIGLCTSSDIPLLIIIARSGTTVDYDKPTTIKEYLEYLKYQKKNPNKIDHLDFDASGKIKEITLIKKL